MGIQTNVPHSKPPFGSSTSRRLRDFGACFIDSPYAVDGVDRNALRAVRLMRLFTEQLEAMAKLKGKSGQQRVVVEHVHVAIVGTVIPAGGRGENLG